MFTNDKAEATAARDHPVGIQKPIMMHNLQNTGLRIGHSIEELFYATVGLCHSRLSSVWRPGQPSAASRIARFKRKPTVLAQMVVNRPQKGGGVIVGQQRLESMTGHVNEIEVLGQT